MATGIVDEIAAIEWTRDDGGTVRSYYLEGCSDPTGWFCLEVDSLDELRGELHALGFDADTVLAVHGIDRKDQR